MKFKETFCIRADIDSLKGLREGIPEFLNILEKRKMKASIYSIIGWEGDFVSVLKHRFLKRKRISMPHSGNAFKPSFIELQRMLFFPKPFFKEKNFKLIKEKGHELGCHGFVHVKWNSLDNETLNQEFHLMKEKFKESIGFFPKSFSTPLEIQNPEIDVAAVNAGFKFKNYVGKEIFEKKIGKEKIVLVPVTINYSKNNQPIIEQLLSEGKSSAETVKIICREIEKKVNEKNIASFYIHPEVEVLKCKKILEKILNFVKELNLKTKTSEQIAKEFLKRKN